jgi:RNA polymerase sigma-70 factor (ECF subfamily)
MADDGSMGMMADERTLTTSQTVDRAGAFRDLMDRHLEASYRLAAVILRDEVEAEDAVHDALVQAWARFDSLRDRARFEAWFQRILVNVCRDHLRRQSTRIRISDLTLDREVQPELDERDAVRFALDSLSPEHRAVIVLRYFADLSVEDIADRTATRPGTVKSRLHYALRALRAAYEAAQRTTPEAS